MIDGSEHPTYRSQEEWDQLTRKLAELDTNSPEYLRHDTDPDVIGLAGGGSYVPFTGHDNGISPESLSVFGANLGSSHHFSSLSGDSGVDS